MKTIKNIVSLSSAIFVLLLGCSRGDLNASRAPASVDGMSESLSKDELDFLRIINLFRVNLSLTPLKVDQRLNDAAEGHSEWMMGKGILTHSGPGFTGTSATRVIAEGIDPNTLIGENIARGNYGAKETFLQWLYSPPHLLGMITPEYDHIGISRSDCDADQPAYCFWTTDFAALNPAAETPEREFTVEEVARAAEAVVGPLGEDRENISLNEADGQSRWQRLKNRIRGGAEEPVSEE